MPCSPRIVDEPASRLVVFKKCYSICLSSRSGHEYARDDNGKIIDLRLAGGLNASGWEPSPLPRSSGDIVRSFLSAEDTVVLLRRIGQVIPSTSPSMFLIYPDC